MCFLLMRAVAAGAADAHLAVFVAVSRSVVQIHVIVKRADPHSASSTVIVVLKPRLKLANCLLEHLDLRVDA
jgi:hypothetical protein